MTAIPNENFKAVRGAIHVHTNYDDGSGSIEDLLEAAVKTETDFVVITDHHVAHAAKDNWPGWHKEGKVLLVVGVEMRTRDKHDVVSVGPHAEVATKFYYNKQALGLLKSLGAAVFIAHPQGCRQHFLGIYLHRWQDWELPLYDGVEIWSYMHDWMRDFRFWKLPDMCKNPEKYILGPEPEVLTHWDKQAQKRKVAAIGALDSHAKIAPFALSKIFSWLRGGILPYQQNFAAFSHYALVSKDWGISSAVDTQNLQDSLAEGRGWICQDELASGRNFSFTLVENNIAYPVGSETTFKTGQELVITASPKARICLKNRGKLVAEKETEKLLFKPTDPGEYRAELYLQDKPWIFTNHIYLR